MSKNQETKTVFKTIGYDLPSEQTNELKPIVSDDADQAKEKRKKEAYRWLHNRRIDFWNDLCNWGRRVNNSVFVVPEDNLKEVEDYIKKTREDYEQFFIAYKDTVRPRKPDIVVIEFHESEEERLRRMAESVLIGDLEKLHEEISKLQREQSLNPRTLGVKPSTKSKFESTIDQVLSLTEDFKINCPRIHEHAKILAAKLDEVKVQEQ